MKHPTREAWVPFLYGETDPATTKEMAEHLKGCSACAAELADWRRSLRRLDHWKVPALPTPRTAAAPMLLKWAVAAALVLGLGFGWGRWSAPSAGQIQRELNAQWQRQFQALQDTVQQAAAQIRREVLQASATQTRDTLGQWTETMRAEQAEDLRALRVMYDTFQRQHTRDFIGLRKDLETVATRADEEIRRARRQFIELTAMPNLNDQKTQ